MKKFLDRALIAVFVSIWLFILIILGVFIYAGSVPDELIIGFFSVFGGEGLLCAVITVIKQIYKTKNDGADGEGAAEEEDSDGME